MPETQSTTLHTSSSHPNISPLLERMAQSKHASVPTPHAPKACVSGPKKDCKRKASARSEWWPTAFDAVYTNRKMSKSDAIAKAVKSGGFVVGVQEPHWGTYIWFQNYEEFREIWFELRSSDTRHAYEVLCYDWVTFVIDFEVEEARNPMECKATMKQLEESYTVFMDLRFPDRWKASHESGDNKTVWMNEACDETKTSFHMGDHAVVLRGIQDELRIVVKKYKKWLCEHDQMEAYPMLFMEGQCGIDTTIYTTDRLFRMTGCTKAKEPHRPFKIVGANRDHEGPSDFYSTLVSRKDIIGDERRRLKLPPDWIQDKDERDNTDGKTNVMGKPRVKKRRSDKGSTDTHTNGRSADCLWSEERICEITLQLTVMLSKARSQDREEWLNIGYRVHSLTKGSQPGLDSWIRFSKLSEKFKEGECEREWGNMTCDQRWTVHTLFTWARRDNPAEYKKWKQKSLSGEEKRSMRYAACLGVVEREKHRVGEKGAEGGSTADTEMKQYLEKIAGEGINVVRLNIPNIRDFAVPPGTKTIVVISSTGTGKTEFAVNMAVESPGPALCIAPRKTFAYMMKSALKDFCIYLSDIDKPDSRTRSKDELCGYARLIIQLESLWKVGWHSKCGGGFGILDEFSSICRQFSSSTMKENRRACFAAFEDHVARFSLLLAMDAFMTVPEIELLRKMRGTEGFCIVYNEHKPELGTESLFYSDEAQWECKLMTALHEGKRTCVVFNTRMKAKSVFNTICYRFPGKNVKLYTGTHGDRSDFFNVDEAWKDVDVLLYTSVCGIGISYTVGSFDTCFVHISGHVTVLPQDILQMMRRVRSITDKQYHILSTNYGSDYPIPETMAKLEEYVRKIRNHDHNIFLRDNAVVTKFDPEDPNAYVFPGKDQDVYYNVYLINALSCIRAHNNYSSALVRLMLLIGLTVTCVPPDAANLGSSSSFVARSQSSTDRELSLSDSHHLRLFYHIQDPSMIDPQFCTKYGTEKVKGWYTFWCMEAATASVDELIRERRIDLMDYRQKLAFGVGMLRILGHEGPGSKKSIPREVLVHGLEENKHTITGAMEYIKILFLKMCRTMKDYKEYKDFEGRLKFCNSIISHVFGITVKASARIRTGEQRLGTSYMINTSKIDQLFVFATNDITFNPQQGKKPVVCTHLVTDSSIQLQRNAMVPFTIEELLMYPQK